MKRLRNHLIGVDHGDIVLFSDFEQGGIMWTGDGPRQTRAWIEFSEVFRSPPAVTVGLSMFDMSKDSNPRADVRAEDITGEGFAIRFQTWGDSKIARIRVSWQAIGELRHADEWDLY